MIFWINRLMERQILITIGRRIGAGGLQTAHELAERLGVKVYDKELIWLAAKESGLSPEVFAGSDEKSATRRPFAGIFEPRNNNYDDTGNYSNAISDDDLFKMQSDIIRKVAENGSGIFVGRCADYVLRDYPSMVSVFITAEMEDRIRRVAEVRGITEKEAAKFIEQNEKKRASYYNYYTFKEWGDSASYDICLNSSRFGIEGCVRTIISMLSK